ncbi:MAG: cell division protein FtsB [Gallionella sp.]|jgi:cell division protein FtsB|nr:cell division protein FtsB [Gallionella sp.]MDD4959408.1 cell division protein FtsB [Gallionella sp.]
MKSITNILLVLLLLLQYPMWLGKGGWIKVWDLNRQIDQEQASNQQLEARNALLDADVTDLKRGTEAIEERARNDLGMVKSNEVFYRILAAPPAPASTVSAVSAASAVGTQK